MLIKKSDIGGEIISIITRGMYLDPKDTLREYVQNGVDALAKNIFIKIRQNNIVVEDNGTGMDKETMRKSIRVGISDKSPSKNVGFMGIGIYSSFHLCDELHIYSKVKNKTPVLLKFDFKSMRLLLENQRELRYKSSFNPENIIALQDLLENHIELLDLKEDEYPKVGTRVEMIGLEPTFFKSLSQFEEVSSYLEQVVPLPFNPKFSPGGEIHHYIHQKCRDNSADFSIVNLELQINEETQNLFRPFKDEQFEPRPFDPEFYILKSDNDFFGVAWGCLNASKRTIKNSVRGFTLKKQGFTIGSKSDLLQYFGRPTYFNRYAGEIIVVHPQLLPNASRSEFEYSPLRIIFQNSLKEMASFYNLKADTFQEQEKAQEVFNEAVEFLKRSKAQYSYLYENPNELLKILWEAKEYSKDLEKRKSAGKFDIISFESVNTLVHQLDSFCAELSDLIEINKRTKKTNKKRKSQSTIVEEIENIPKTTDIEPDNDYNSINEVIESIGIEISKELSILLELIDENFIRNQSIDNDDYMNKLVKLKKDFEELLNE